MHRRDALIAEVLAAPLFAACRHEPYNRRVAGAGMNIHTTGFLGAASVTINIGMCAGRVALTQGEATVRDPCFTGDTNVVLFTDATAANPIKCSHARVPDDLGQRRRHYQLRVSALKRSKSGTIVKRAAILALVCSTLASAACVSVNLAAPGEGAQIGGPLEVAGPLRVQGDLYVGGPATIHGPVQARALTVGGPVKTTFPRGEPPGPAGQAFATSLAVGGPLTVYGPLIVEGALTIGGPLTSEPDQESSEIVPQQSQVFTPRGDLPPQKPSPQAEWTE